MKVITRQMRANEAAAKWQMVWERSLMTPMQQWGKKLLALGPNPDPDKVDEIIGNGNWTANTCHVCRRNVELTIEFDVNHNIRYRVCTACIVRARRMLADFGKKAPEAIPQENQK